MVQSKNILGYKITPVESPVLIGLNNHSKESPELLNRGSFHILSPLNYIEAIQEGGTRQSILFPISAGNEPRISTMRPNPYLSIGIEERRRKIFRGVLQLSSQTN